VIRHSTSNNIYYNADGPFIAYAASPHYIETLPISKNSNFGFTNNFNAAVQVNLEMIRHEMSKAVLVSEIIQAKIALELL